MINSRICSLFGTRLPIVQGGMIWCSGWQLASSVSNCGGLGLLGAGSMYPDVLREQIVKCRNRTEKPFGVNVPLLYPQIDEIIKIIIEERIKIVFTSAGNPSAWTSKLKDNGITVAHVVSSAKFAEKAQKAGVDAVVAEGFEAGGHNGREETTTLCLIPSVRQTIDLPLIAAGGIGSGKAILAAMALGADGVQIGSLFAASSESSAHPSFKERIAQAKEGDTFLTLKELAPVRLLQNEFLEKVKQAYAQGSSTESLKELLGRGRAKKGMFEGDLVEGELEIGQISSMISNIRPVSEIIADLVVDFNQSLSSVKKIDSLQTT